MEFISWDDDIPNIWKVMKFHKIPWFQSPPTSLSSTSTYIPIIPYKIPWFQSPPSSKGFCFIPQRIHHRIIATAHLERSPTGCPRHRLATLIKLVKCWGRILMEILSAPLQSARFFFELGECGELASHLKHIINLESVWIFWNRWHIIYHLKHEYTKTHGSV